MITLSVIMMRMDWVSSLLPADAVCRLSALLGLQPPVSSLLSALLGLQPSVCSLLDTS